MICNKCKTELPEEACFCLKCGEKVEINNITERSRIASNRLASAIKQLNKKGISKDRKIKLLIQVVIIQQELLYIHFDFIKYLWEESCKIFRGCGLRA